MCKSFQTSDVKTIAVNNASFEMEKGDFVAITGASGSGKSTFLSLIALLDQADSGTYELSGTEVSQLSFAQKSQVRNKYLGVIYQAFNLINELSVFDNVALPLKYSKDIPKSDVKKLVSESLERVGMSHRMHHMPNELSGGEQQRVAISRSLVTSPVLILADEPTGNLDTQNSDNIMNILSNLNRENEVSIVLITHDKDQASMANVKYHMLDGNLTKQ